jgi:hypothetical protein
VRAKKKGGVSRWISLGMFALGDDMNELPVDQSFWYSSMPLYEFELQPCDDVVEDVM